MVQDYSNASGNNTANWCGNWCPYRLPCGWCKEMNAPCRNTGGGTVVWNTTTGTTVLNGEAPTTTL